MMLAFLFLLQATAQGAPPPPAPSHPVVPHPVMPPTVVQAPAPPAGLPLALPTDWSVLAPMPYIKPPEIAASLSGFVATEIAAGRCPIARPVNGHYVVRVDVATLIGADGIVRRTVPRAIHCPTVEQYGAGLVLSFARANIRTGGVGGVGGDQWYRATIMFDWRG
jgi:hypothetical protein